MLDYFKNYLQSIQNKFAMENAAKGREMLYRSDFEILLKSLFQADGKVIQINHDSTNDKGNKPDFAISKNGIPRLYIEAKDIGVNLDKIEKSDQMDRYFGYDNLVLTDYLEFRFYRNGVRYNEAIKIANFDKNTLKISFLEQNFALLEKTIQDFADSHKEPLKSGLHLAKIMGGKAQRIRDNVQSMLKMEHEDNRDLLKIREVVRENLVAGLQDEDFADMYAQTLVYGLFAARYDDSTPDTFTRAEARDLVPRSNPFLRSFFDHIAGSSFPKRLSFIVDELCEIFTHADIAKLLSDFYKKEKDDKDPIIHFYEDFLKEYNPSKKMEMGVFYTPKQVVNFIVRGVDEVLKTEFGLPKGLADNSKIEVVKVKKDAYGKEHKDKKEYHRVQVLDVATGTGTFLNEVINHVHSSFKGQEGRWPSYASSDLLPRLHGFELMMASYTIAHLKLGITLHDTGVSMNDRRLGVYLTNTLDKPVNYEDQGTLFGFMDSIAEESKTASRIKAEYPIMCIIGNPPYSGISMNNHYTENDVYKVEPGGKEKLNERKHWLNDDYVKFIRFAENMVENRDQGVVGMITAHGYIDNPTFRGMRWHLRKTFDKIYIIDLHGNSNKKETTIDGSKDENVFDIKTGVSIIIAIKKGNDKFAHEQAKIYKADFYGLRKDKFNKLDEGSLAKIDWIELPDEADRWLLESDQKGEYEIGFGINELFPTNTTGIVSMGDGFIIDINKDEIEKRMENLLFENPSESELNQKYGLGKNYSKWILENKNKIQFDHSKIIKFDYRPFDQRYTYFDKNLIWRSRDTVTKHFIGHENLGLVFARSQKNPDWNALFISKYITEAKLGESSTQSAVAPLYLYTSDGQKMSNLDPEIVKKIEAGLGLSLDWEIPLLEGWTLKADGVDSLMVKSHSSTDEVDSLPIWQQNSLFPFWNLPKNKSLEANAKKLRQAGVLSEVLFWQAFNNKKLIGFDLDRQVIIGNYIVDFMIPELGLVIEIDGESHDFKGKHDQDRENYLTNLDLEIIHYKDIEIKKSMDFVSDSFLVAIKKRVEWLKENPPRHRSAMPPLNEGNLQNLPTEELKFSATDLLDYIYAVLHSPSYREKYKELLKSDFPRVPYPDNQEKFWSLVGFGSKLRKLHLLEDAICEDFVTTFPVGGSDEVEKVSFKESTPSASRPPLNEGNLENSALDLLNELNYGDVWINETQYFGNVPEIAWNFYIGGYQPAQKYLKDRKGKALSSDEIEQWQRIVRVLLETSRIMGEIG